MNTVGATLLPRSQQYYYSFGAPIDTTRWTGQHDSDAAARELRDEVRASVEQTIPTLLAIRAAELACRGC
jgi:hypothetical protein